MRFRPVVVVALLVVVLTGGVVASAAPDGAVADQHRVGEETQPVPVDSVERDVAASTTGPFDRADPGLVVTIQLQENGDARWHITHRFVVNGSNETAAFERFATGVKNGTRNVGTTKATFSRFAEAASEATGREMSVEDAGWSSSQITNGTGEITYSFTWTNFGQVDGELLRVGDAFRSPNGTWFPRLYDGQRLVIKPPSSLAIVGTPPDKGVTDRALVWDGYREFEPGYLSVVLDTRENTGTTNGTDGIDDDLSMSPFLLGVGFALLLVLVGVGSYLFARRQTIRDEDGAVGASGSSTDDGPDGPAGGGSGASDASGAGTDDAVTSTAEDGSASGGSSSTGSHGDDAVGGGAVADGNTAVTAEAPESTAEDAGDATTPAGGDAAGSAAESASAAGGGAAAAEETAADTAADEDGDADEEETIDESLLSDEERVLRLLDQNGGRMKQANIVTETGWSNAKVSQLLSGMAEDDAIQKLRIGRENLITLPDENVGDFGNDDE